MARALFLAVALLAATALAQDSPPEGSAVATWSGVVIHGVDSKLLAAKLRDTDRKVLAGDAKGAGADLAEILTGDVSPLIEDGDNAYLGAMESALQRIAALPPEGLAGYRDVADPRALALLDAATAHADPSKLALHALDMALTTHGPRMLVTLADLRASRGDVRGAAAALADLLRLWPDAGATAEMPGVERAAVIARLAAISASLGDESTVRWLKRDASAALLDGPSPVSKDVKFGDELERLARVAAARSDAPSIGETPELVAVAETVFSKENRGDFDAGRSREIEEHPIAVGTASAPVLLTRVPRSPANREPRVVALAPQADGGTTLVRLWHWPADEEFKSGLRRGGRGAFTPARCGDVVVFPWPRAPDAPSPDEDFPPPDEETNTLVALSIGAEGRLVDERGVAESGRDDADPELATMSFCGRPLVVGESVYTTMVRRAENGGATQLHVARFDLVSEGAATHLHLRWRRHVLDGSAMPKVQLDADLSNEFMGSALREPLAIPAAMAERWGRIYVCGNTGAVACLDGSSGRTLWAQAYRRLGPPNRHAISRTVQKTWKDVPIAVDGPFVWAAPRDSESLLEFRAMPRLAKTTLLDEWRFHGGSGTSTVAGQVFPGLLPDEVVSIADGTGLFSGGVTGRGIAGLVPAGSPLASLRLRDAAAGEPRRSYGFAQIQESAPSGSPCAVPGAVLLPTAKAIYRVALATFDSAPAVLFRKNAPAGAASPDQIGNLVADDGRLWSVTPHRAVLFAPRK